MPFTDDEVVDLCKRSFRQGLTVEVEGLFDHVLEDHAALQRVWRLHKRKLVPGMYQLTVCEHDDQPWPCATIDAVTGPILVPPAVRTDDTRPDEAIPPPLPTP